MRSLPVMPNFVDVVDIVVTPRGKTYDCSKVVISTLLFENADISELTE